MVDKIKRKGYIDKKGSESETRGRRKERKKRERG